MLTVLTQTPAVFPRNRSRSHGDIGQVQPPPLQYFSGCPTLIGNISRPCVIRGHCVYPEGGPASPRKGAGAHPRHQGAGLAADAGSQFHPACRDRSSVTGATGCWYPPAKDAPSSTVGCRSGRRWCDFRSCPLLNGKPFFRLLQVVVFFQRRFELRNIAPQTLLEPISKLRAEVDPL
jgi:hypothetical protein